MPSDLALHTVAQTETMLSSFCSSSFKIQNRQWKRSDVALSLSVFILFTFHSYFFSGLIAVGSCNGDVTTAILQILIEKSESNLKETHARFLALALGLCYLQKQDLVETIIAALEVVTTSKPSYFIHL